MEPRIDPDIEEALDNEIRRLENSLRDKRPADAADTVGQRLATLAPKFGIRLQCWTCRGGSPEAQSLVYCHNCRRCFHSVCWAKDEGHSTEFTDEPCTGSSPLPLHIWVAHLHNSKVRDEDVLKSIANDRCHRWMGIADPSDTARDNSSIKAAKPELLLYPTLTKLFTDSGGIVAAQRPRKQYPRLVSFFGETGAGKSTVVKNLIRLLHVSFDETADVPVTSPSGRAESSTSGGVHVYTDPKSLTSSAPIVYADCEGLGGAEPLANSGWQEIREQQGHGSRRLLSHSPFTGSHNRTIPLPQMPAVATLALPWVADDDKPDPWQKYVVKEIYPRFLYIFSDVVCYVTRNTKGAEEDMAQLIDWARNGHDLTTNQGMKPGLIYIINQDNQPDFSQWKDSNFATQKILDKLQCSNRFVQEQDTWKRRGCPVSSVLQLLEKYYDSVQVVFLPEFLPRRPSCEAHQVQSQYELLYNEIDRRSRAGAARRRDAGLLMDLDRLSRHSVSVLRKLAENFNSPVDLYGLLETLQPYPSNFKSHVLNFLAWFTDGEQRGLPRQVQEPGYESSIIERVTAFVATCVAGEVVRTHQVGPETSVAQVVSNYTQEWKAILETFASTQCRCEEVFHNRTCQNHEMTHIKGHQFHLTDSSATVIVVGSYLSTFPAKIPCLLDRFHDELKRALASSNRDTRVWSASLCQQARISGAGGNRSNRTCLACLFRTPIHMLPCGHGVCEECAGDLGTKTTCEAHAATLTRCPFGCSWSHYDVPSGGWTMRRKPSEAGVRILSLDGGGVRGILELVILQAIMDKVPFGIPIQELFDLVVGTSTGGIIALGIFKMGWTVEFAIRKFEELARGAFEQRQFLKPVWFFPGARSSARLLCSHVYQSQGIETVLKQSFGEKTKLFGAAADGPELTKVAVVVTTEEDERPFLLTNYNRQWRVNDETNNNLRREERKEDELEIWEAARCTSAAPTYFQPYRHAATGRTYIDGSVERNNPAGIADSERKFIWPTASGSSRDILVSLGTGLATEHSGEPVRSSRLSALLQPLERLSLVGKIVMLRRVLENTTNGEKMWSEFRNSLGPDPGVGARCHRLNVPFGPGTRLGALDDVGHMAAMKGEALAVLAGSSRHIAPRAQQELAEQVAGVARQLVASLFYFQMTAVESIQGGGSLCSGVLRCRLSRASRESSGRRMLEAAPVFRVWEEGGAGNESQTTTLPALEWDEVSLSAKAMFRVWKRPAEVSMSVSFDGMKSWDDISGFPRAVGDAGDVTLPSEPAEMP